MVNLVEQITFSGAQALSQEQAILYVTERCVFELRPDGLHLIEIAPGVDIERDVIENMGFSPIMSESPRLMKSDYFLDDARTDAHA